MTMVLLDTSAIVVQQVGCWSSKAFLEYVREQVLGLGSAEIPPFTALVDDKE